MGQGTIRWQRTLRLAGPFCRLARPAAASWYGKLLQRLLSVGGGILGSNARLAQRTPGGLPVRATPLYPVAVEGSRRVGRAAPGQEALSFLPGGSKISVSVFGNARGACRAGQDAGRQYASLPRPATAIIAAESRAADCQLRRPLTRRPGRQPPASGPASQSTERDRATTTPTRQHAGVQSSEPALRAAVSGGHHGLAYV